MPLAVVTGANRGVGLALVKRLRETGYEVAACCREPADADDLRAFAQAAGGVAIHALDVTDDAAASGVAAGMADRSVDLLIANAGVFGGSRQTFEDFSAADMLQTLNVNTVGVARTIEAFLPLVDKGAEKKIAAISSGMGGIAETGGSYYAYRASKAALNMFLKLYAAEEPEVHFTALAPGLIDTAMQAYISTIEDDADYETIQRLKAARNTPDMPSAEEAARSIIDILDKLKQRESGAFVDIRKMNQA